MLKGKGGDSAYIQVFIEPKGKHLAGEDNDLWKEKFLLEISKEYGFGKPFVKESDKYVLFGLPFFNKTDGEMYNKFKDSFGKTLKLKIENEYAEDKEMGLKVADGIK